MTDAAAIVAAAPAAPVAPVATTPAPVVAPVADAPLTNLLADAKPVVPLADAKPDAKPADATVTADAKPAPLFPDLKLPENMKPDDPLLTGFMKDASEAGMNKDQVQKLVDKYAGKLVTADEVKAQLDAPNNLWKSTQQQWQTAVKSDPEVGGSNLTANLANIAKVIDSVGGTSAAAIRQALNLTGAGNNPEIVRFLHRVAANLNVEGRTIPAGGPSTVTFQTAAERIYGSKAAN